jgi:hypothetical protein
LNSVIETTFRNRDLETVLETDNWKRLLGSGTETGYLKHVMKLVVEIGTDDFLGTPSLPKSRAAPVTKTRPALVAKP